MFTNTYEYLNIKSLAGSLSEQLISGQLLNEPNALETLKSKINSLISLETRSFVDMLPPHVLTGESPIEYIVRNYVNKNNKIRFDD